MKKPFFILLMMLGFVLATNFAQAGDCCGGCGDKGKGKDSKGNGMVLPISL
jgi:hypothetical protein